MHAAAPLPWRAMSTEIGDRPLGLDPRLADWTIAGGLALALTLQLALGDYEGSTALNMVSGLVLTLPLALRRGWPLPVLATFCTTAIVNEALGGALFTFPEEAGGHVPLFAALATGMVVFYSVAAYLDDRRAAAALAAGIAGLWATVVTSDQIEIASFIWSGALVGATPWFAGRVARSRRLRIAALEREQEQRTRVALADERARIARELHDVVAHSVGVIVVQAQGARRVIERDPGRAAEALEVIEETARSALGDMRGALGVLREGDGPGAPERAPQPGAGDIAALVERSRAGGLDIALSVEGERRPLPQALDLTAYRIVQEAITNTIKHAPGARSRVAVRYGDRELVVSVSDDGPGPPADVERWGGHGLIGMHERVTALGGELETGSGPGGGGFAVRATLPLE